MSESEQRQDQERKERQERQAAEMSQSTPEASSTQPGSTDQEHRAISTTDINEGYFQTSWLIFYSDKQS